DGEKILARESVENLCFWPVENGLHAVPNYSIGTRWYMLHLMSTQTVRLHRWDEIALEKVTEMLSRKVVTGEREMTAQIYLKRGCLVPMHSHESEQMTYI